MTITVTPVASGSGDSGVPGASAVPAKAPSQGWETLNRVINALVIIFALCLVGWVVIQAIGVVSGMKDDKTPVTEIVTMVTAIGGLITSIVSLFFGISVARQGLDSATQANNAVAQANNATNNVAAAFQKQQVATDAFRSSVASGLTELKDTIPSEHYAAVDSLLSKVQL